MTVRLRRSCLLLLVAAVLGWMAQAPTFGEPLRATGEARLDNRGEPRLDNRGEPRGTAGSSSARGAFADAPDAPDAKLKAALEQAFARAFSTGPEFRETRLFDCLGYSPEQVRAIVEVTPRPATLSVEFEPDPTVLGKYGRLRVVAQDVHYYNLLIARAALDFSGATLDPAALDGGRLLFREIGQVGIETRVTAPDIIKVFGLFASARQLSRLKLKIRPKRTTLTGLARRGILTVAFAVTGMAEVQDPKQIRFNCRRMVVNGLSLPRGMIRAMFSSINPVFDARKTWLNLELEKIVSEEGAVVSTGRLLGPTPVTTVAPADATAGSPAGAAAPPETTAARGVTTVPANSSSGNTSGNTFSSGPASSPAATSSSGSMAAPGATAAPRRPAWPPSPATSSPRLRPVPLPTPAPSPLPSPVPSAVAQPRG